MGALLVALSVVQLTRPIPTGPLQVSGPVNSFGLAVQADGPFSMVVFYRSERPALATLRGLALADADRGLAVIGSGIGSRDLQDPYYADFPPQATLLPIDGRTVQVGPGAGKSEITFVLGLELAEGVEEAAARGVWLYYEVDGTSYRALIPWLVRFCRLPVSEPCQGPEIRDFAPPPIS